MEERININRIDKAFCIIFYVITAASIFVCLVLRSAETLPFFSAVYDALYSVLPNLVPFLAGLRLIFVGIKTWLQAKENGLKKTSGDIGVFFAALISFIAVYLYWTICPGDILICLALFTAVGAVGVPFKKLAKVWFIVEIIYIGIMFLGALFGLVTNVSGNSWGFIYRTDYAALLLYVFLLYLFWHSGKLSGAGWTFVLVLFGFNLIFVGGKTSVLCMAIALLVTFFHSEKIRKILLLKQPSQKLCCIGATVAIVLFASSFVLLAALAIALGIAYPCLSQEFMQSIPYFGSMIERFQLSYIGFDIFDPQLWGNAIYQNGWGGTGALTNFYFFLDSSYIRLLLQNGIVLFAVMLIWMTFTQVRLGRRKMIYRMFLLALVAFDCFVEHHMVDLAYNVFLLLIFSKFDLEENAAKSPAGLFPKPFGIVSGKVSKWAGASGAKGILHKTCLLLATALVLVASYGCILSAREITCWSGNAPEYDATIILPVDQLLGRVSPELLTNQENSVYVYLQMNRDAMCIVGASDANAESATECKQRLEELGVDSDRIIVETGSANMKELLVSADEKIKKEGLPTRKTICAPAIMQTSISVEAKELGMAVSGIRARLPEAEYPAVFVNEQLQYLKHEFFNAANSN